MTRSTSTNVLLVLMLVALLANLTVLLTRPTAAYAVKKSEVAQEAVQVSESIAPDRVLGDIAAALRDVANSNREIASAIREHGRATERIAQAVRESADARIVE